MQIACISAGTIINSWRRQSLLFLDPWRALGEKAPFSSSPEYSSLEKKRQKSFRCSTNTTAEQCSPAHCENYEKFRTIQSITKKKWSHFELKSWVTGGTKIWSGIPCNWRIFEPNWIAIESQIDSPLRVKLTRHWESNWLAIESQIDSLLRSIWRKYFQLFPNIPIIH